jgi:hypothetical protein
MIKHLERNQIIILFAIIGVLTVFITLLVYLSEEREIIAEYETPEISPEDDLKTSDFLMNKPVLLNLASEYYLLRKQYRKWDWIQAEKYWIDIKKILIDIITLENDQEMEELIESIP